VNRNSCWGRETAWCTSGCAQRSLPEEGKSRVKRKRGGPLHRMTQEILLSRMKKTAEQRSLLLDQVGVYCMCFIKGFLCEGQAFYVKGMWVESSEVSCILHIIVCIYIRLYSCILLKEKSTRRGVGRDGAEG
jgi:hypothetical protein